jgi:hypothetical protein
MAKKPNNISLKETLEKLCGKNLSNADTAECEFNLFGFFDLFYQIDTRNHNEGKSNEYSDNRSKY